MKPNTFHISSNKSQIKLLIFPYGKQPSSTRRLPYLCFDHERPFPQTVQKVKGWQHRTKLLEVAKFELVGQRCGRDPGQQTQAGQGARCHRGLWDLSWHGVRLGRDHSCKAGGWKKRRQIEVAPQNKRALLPFAELMLQQHRLHENIKLSFVLLFWCSKSTELREIK